MPRSMIAGWYSKSLFNFVRNHQAVFQSAVVCCISPNNEWESSSYLTVVPIDVEHLFIITFSNHSFLQLCAERLYCYHPYLAAEQTEQKASWLAIFLGKVWSPLSDFSPIQLMVASLLNFQALSLLLDGNWEAVSTLWEVAMSGHACVMPDVR